MYQRSGSPLEPSFVGILGFEEGRIADILVKRPPEEGAATP